MNKDKDGPGICGTDASGFIADVQQDVGYTLAANIASLRYEDIREGQRTEDYYG